MHNGQVLGPQAQDGLGPLQDRPALIAGKVERDVAELERLAAVVVSPFRKFIAGLPMKPATNRLAGRL